MTEHPSAELDDVIHQRVRLGVLSILAQTREADFTYLRDTLGVTDGNLGRHLDVLNEAGYVGLNRTFEGRRPRTWVTITPKGRRALAGHVRTLKAMLPEMAEAGPDPKPIPTRNRPGPTGDG